PITPAALAGPMATLAIRAGVDAGAESRRRPATCKASASPSATGAAPPRAEPPLLLPVRWARPARPPSRWAGRLPFSHGRRRRDEGDGPGGCFLLGEAGTLRVDWMGRRSRTQSDRSCPCPLSVL